MAFPTTGDADSEEFLIGLMHRLTHTFLKRSDCTDKGYKSEQRYAIAKMKDECTQGEHEEEKAHAARTF